MPAELVAERIGHADGGALGLKTYRHVRCGETRASLVWLGHGFRAAARAGESNQPGAVVR